MTNPVAGDEQQLRARIEAWRRGKAMTATEIYELAVEMARFILAAPAPPVRAAEPDMAVGLEQRQYDASERASLSGAVPLPVCEYCRHPLQKERDSETRFCPNPGCRRFLVPAVPSTKEPKL